MVAPVYEVDDIAEDPQFRARSLLARVPDADLGTVTMPTVRFRLSRTPGSIRWAGPRLGEHTEELLPRSRKEEAGA